VPVAGVGPLGIVPGNDGNPEKIVLLTEPCLCRACEVAHGSHRAFTATDTTRCNVLFDYPIAFFDLSAKSFLCISFCNFDKQPNVVVGHVDHLLLE